MDHPAPRPLCLDDWLISKGGVQTFLLVIGYSQRLQPMTKGLFYWAL